jgi:hypothetical protein
VSPDEEFANDHRGEMALFLVYNVDVSRENGESVTSGGATYVESNWVIDMSCLASLGYSYSLPEKQ